MVHCGLPKHRAEGLRAAAAGVKNPYRTIGAIPPPPGYRRVTSGTGSFAGWLRTLPLKKDRTVHLYDGTLKDNQDAYG